MTGPALGIDIGGTYTKCVVLDAGGEVLHRQRMPTDDTAARRLPADVAHAVADIEGRFGAMTTLGIACPGLVRRDGNVVHWMRGRLDVLEGLDWTRALQRSAPVHVINDAHAALAGECALGAGRGCPDVVMLTLGTGVGGAIMCDGRVLRGHSGRAGHLGHIALQVPGDKDIVNTPWQPGGRNRQLHGGEAEQRPVHDDRRPGGCVVRRGCGRHARLGGERDAAGGRASPPSSMPSTRRA